jgi:peptidoglycan hydrolase CwlO-like protein
MLAPPAQGDLAGRYQAGKRQAEQLKSAIGADSDRIRGFEGTIGNLESRLKTVQASVRIQEEQLAKVQGELSDARTQLASLRARYAHDQQVLAAQLVAQYESPPPTLVDVVVNAQGFNELLNGVRNLQTIEQRNVEEVRNVKLARQAVAAQTVRLAQEQARRQRATAAVLVERDNIAQLRLSIVERELTFERARAGKTRQLNALRHTLAHEAAVLNARAARAQARAQASAAFSGGVAPLGCVNTPFVAHGGPYGFFQAAGTNYSVGEEPIIAARLNALGENLHLHLIGISGYRSPAHSVEVGGFADDPHTKGLASDTPGVEGVPESTLLAYCLTRPFPGPREADHIQES